MNFDFYGSPDQIDMYTYEEYLTLLETINMKTEFLLSKKQPSKKAWMVNVKGMHYFIPKSFPHEVVENYKLIVQLPDWFELK